MKDPVLNGHAAFTAVIHADRATVEARGELEIFTVDLLRGALAHLALHHPARITVNLSEVTSIDRHSARLLLTWQYTGAPDTGVAVTLRNPNPDIAAILATEPTPLGRPQGHLPRGLTPPPPRALAGDHRILYDCYPNPDPHGRCGR